MRRHAWCIALSVAASTVPGRAQTLNVTQAMRGNVYGVLQVGPQIRPTTVVQTGPANIAGVIQAGANPSAAIRQSGRSNAAFIGQYENFFPGARTGMP